MLVAVGAVGYRSLNPGAAPQQPPGSQVRLPATAPTADTPAARALLNQEAASGVAQLASMYQANTTKVSWQAANALTAIIQYMQSSGSRAYLSDINATYMIHAGEPHPYVRKYYDDEGWWALAWIKAYDETGDYRYLTLSRNLFANLTRGWTRSCGGGVLWAKFSPYKNSITNELFLRIAIELHNRVPGDTYYKRWALREWAWFRSSGMLRPSGLVVDGEDPATCSPMLNSPTWTYNQGMLIGGLLALHGITHQRTLLATAEKVASAVIHSPALSPHGILQEPAACGSTRTCFNDSPTFKGLFVANLKQLYNHVHVAAYQRYLLRNLASMWAHDRRGAAFGESWQGPFDGSDTGRQVSGVDLLNTQVTRP